MLPALLLVSLVLPARAGGLQAKASREPLPAREVERALVLPRGWTEVELAVGATRAEEAWDSDGAVVPLDVARRELAGAITVRHGLLPHHELWLRLPWHQVAVGEARNAGLGDPSFGWRIGLLRREPPNRSVALELAWEAAAADEDPEVPLGAGTPELRVGLGGRQQYGGLALTARVAWVWRLVGLAGYLPAEAGGLRAIDPGDLLVADVEAALQAGPLVLAGRPVLTRRGVTRVEDAAPAPFGRSLLPVEGSDGTGVELQVRLTLALTRAVELTGWTWRPILGEDFVFPWVEELNPTRGTTWGGAATVRF